MSARKLFRIIRIFFLLILLIGVAAGSWLTGKRSTQWQHPLWVVIYPIKADNSVTTHEYINALNERSFTTIETFFSREATKYNLALTEPVTIRLAPEVTSLPPSPPVSGATWEIILWSLQLRYWAFINDNFTGPAPDIRMFVQYHEGHDNKELQHSLGLQEGMLGIVNAFADDKMSQSNNVVIAHEILHTLGATDKYNFNTGQPVYPSGYANPELSPRYPQQKAEIMGGKIPLSGEDASIPAGLHQVIIGSQTAREIKWVVQ